VSGHVVVAGSVNMDVSVRCARLPRPGETLLAASLHRSGGGKGANQAVAAARVGGARTRMIGAVGRDADGDALLADLRGEGIDSNGIQRLEDHLTGVALSTVDDKAANTIVVAAGANAQLRIGPADREVLKRADVVLAQLEVPQRVAAAAAACRRPAVPFLLNAAPSAPLEQALRAQVDVLIVNEHEATDLAGSANLGSALRSLLAVVPAVLVTLGSRGARLLRRDGTDLVVPAPRVTAVDTVAAGDTFCGVYAAYLADGADDLTAIRRASAAASLAVQRTGAQTSVSTAAETLRQAGAVYG